MAVDIVIPALGESITEGTILRWLKNAGEAVERDEIVVEIETDKATMELAAPEAGVLSEILKPAGEKVEIGEIIGRVTPGAAAARPASAPAVTDAPTTAAPAQPQATAAPLSPAVRRLVEEHAVNPVDVAATGRGGRITKGDMLEHVAAKAAAPVTPPAVVPKPAAPPPIVTPLTNGNVPRERPEPMSRIRRRIAERLKQVQNTAAILT